VKDLPTETYKALLQLVVIAVAGHVVSILITKANNERLDLLSANELRNRLLDRLNKCYVDVKKIRRIVRATAYKVVIDQAPHLYVERAKFHEFLQLINDAQLELELVSKDVESNKMLFADSVDIILRLDSMEEYLNTIIDEYEHSTVTPVEEPRDCYAVDSFENLSDLLGNYKTSIFRRQFVHPYYASLESIRNAFVTRPQGL
jgi:hypothetical protein